LPIRRTYIECDVFVLDTAEFLLLPVKAAACIGLVLSARIGDHILGMIEILEAELALDHQASHQIVTSLSKGTSGGSHCCFLLLIYIKAV
jgi:hypothetical protein